MNYTFQEVLDIGLEIEFSNIKRDTGNFVEALYKKTGGQYKSVHDASAESPEITLGNIPIQFNVGNKYNKFLSILKFKGLETLGGELNSQILSSQNFKEHIYRLTDFLLDMGESYSTTEQDNRGSIHIHVNVSKDIKHKHLVRLLETGLATESIFFKLGGMGRVNRGVKNNFAYQRPLTMPPCIQYNNKYYPIFDYKDLLNSTNKLDFYNKYGDTIMQIEAGNHYVTQRYTGLNFYSIPYRGSIEFRYFNKTLIPEWICACIVLCQSFVNYALTKEFDETFEETYRKLEDNREIPEGELIYILNKFNISEDDIITILDIWHESTMPNFNGLHQLSHLENPNFFHRDLAYKPTPIDYAYKIDVVNVRKLNGEKSAILNKVRLKEDNKLSEVDFVLENNNIEDKYINVGVNDINLNDVFNVIDNLNDEEEITIETKLFYQKLGLNLDDYTMDDLINWANDRISEGKFIPFRFFRKDWWFEFNTAFDDVTICINIAKDCKSFQIEFVSYDRTSQNVKYNSIYKNQYKSWGYEFSDVVSDVHYNPENYFDIEFDDNVEEENN